MGKSHDQRSTLVAEQCHIDLLAGKEGEILGRHIVPPGVWLVR